MAYNDYLFALGHVENTNKQKTQTNDMADIELDNLQGMLDILQRSSSTESSYRSISEQYEDLRYNQDRGPEVCVIFLKHNYLIINSWYACDHLEDMLIYGKGFEPNIYILLQEIAFRTLGKGYLQHTKDFFDEVNVAIDSAYDFNSYNKLRYKILNAYAYDWLLYQISSSYPTEPSAFELLSLLAKEGNAQALNNLGWMYWHGKGVSKDTKQATDCFMKGDVLGSLVAKKNYKTISNMKNRIMSLISRTKQKSIDSEILWEK